MKFNAYSFYSISYKIHCCSILSISQNKQIHICTYIYIYISLTLQVWIEVGILKGLVIENEMGGEHQTWSNFATCKDFLLLLLLTKMRY